MAQWGWRMPRQLTDTLVRQNFQSLERYLADVAMAQRSASNVAATGAVKVDLAQGDVHTLKLTGPTTLSFTGAVVGVGETVRLRLVQDATGSRVVTWPAGTKWPAGTAPTLSTAANAVDVVVLTTVDGGIRWDATLLGKDYK